MKTVTFKSAEAHLSSSEQDIRIQLAAAYRVFAQFGWTETIFNHITARVPGSHKHFLINPFGYLYEHVTASNLVKIDINGHPVEASPHPVNPAGFTIHAAIHGAREDAACVIHTHTPAGMAIAQLRDGLEFGNLLSAQFYGRISYHAFEGITLDLHEQARLVSDLGSCNAMILRNHGLLVLGRSIGEAIWRMFNLERACQIQLLSRGSGLPHQLISPEILEKTARQFQDVVESPDNDVGGTVLAALMRKLDQQDASYRG